MKLSLKEVRAVGMVAAYPDHFDVKSVPSLIKLEKLGLVVMKEGRATLTEKGEQVAGGKVSQ